MGGIEVRSYIKPAVESYGRESKALLAEFAATVDRYDSEWDAAEKAEIRDDLRYLLAVEFTKEAALVRTPSGRRRLFRLDRFGDLVIGELNAANKSTNKSTNRSTDGQDKRRTINLGAVHRQPAMFDLRRARGG